MRIYLSVDMEGVTGLTDPEEMHHGGRGYERGCELMTGDANAVVQGAFDAGAASVLVNDAHGSTKNLRIDLLDERATLIRGPGKPHRMGQGLVAGMDAACFAGYHARAGVAHGVLNHTWMGKEIQNVYLNGEICGETRLVAGFAGSMGVPVALVAGDEAVCEEAWELLGDVETVAVKKGVDRFSAELLPPAVAWRRIREGTARALGRLAAFGPTWSSRRTSCAWSGTPPPSRRPARSSPACGSRTPGAPSSPPATTTRSWPCSGSSP